MKIAVRLFNISSNLNFQGIDRREFDLVPQALEEMNFYLRVRAKFDGMKVQEVGFNGKGVGAEGGAVTDVGNGIEALGTDAGTGNVHAVLGNELLVAAQINGGNGVLRSVATAASWRGKNAERSVQQVAGAADTSCSDEFADVAAGHRFAAQLHLRIDLHFESHFTSELFKHFDIAGGLVSEMKVVTFVHFARMQLLLQDVVRELMGRHQREIAGEGKQQNRVESGRFEQAKFFGKWREQLQASVGPENADRMRFEGHCHGFGSLLRSAGEDVLQHGAMRAMDSIEVADAQERGSEVAGNLVQVVEDLHR